MKLTLPRGLLIGALVISASQAAATPYKFTELGTLGGTYSSARAINNAGQIVGHAYTAGSYAHHAVIWNNLTPTDLGALGGYYDSYATGINNAGQVAGSTQTAGDVGYRATLWNGTTATDLGTLGSDPSYSFANGINNIGQVAGYSSIAGNEFGHYNAAVWNGTTATDLGTVGGGYISIGNTINGEH